MGTILLKTRHDINPAGRANIKEPRRLIAAEKGATGQALLEDTFDRLFARKGKAHINDSV